MFNKSEEHSLYKSVVSPAIAALIERSILHPVDTLITIQQRNKLSIQQATKLVKSNGWRGFYKGFSLPLLIYSAPAQIIMYGGYQYFKDLLSSRHFSQAQIDSGACVLTGILCTVTFCPLEAKRIRDTFKIRPQIAYHPYVLFRGFVPVAFKSLLHIPIALHGASIIQKKLPNHPSNAFISGLLSGSIAQLFTTPMDVIKTNMMADFSCEKASFLQHTKRIFSERRFFDSLGTRMVRHGLSTSLMIGVMNLLNSLIEQDVPKGSEEGPRFL